jgi:hypothetical protein
MVLVSSMALDRVVQYALEIEHEPAALVEGGSPAKPGAPVHCL